MASHTTTGEWKTFELRMRRRRVERLLQRAEAAVDEGACDDARECLEEVARLAPGLPAIATIGDRLAAAPARVRAPVVARAGRSYWGLATALVTVGVVIWYRPPTIIPSQDLGAEVSLPAIHTAEVRPASFRAPRLEPLPAVEPLTPEPLHPVEGTEEDARPGTVVRPPLLEIRPAANVARTETTRADVPRLDGRTRPDEIRRRDEGPSDIAPVSEVVAVATAGVALPPMPPALPADAAVRQTLDGYASAYNGLDAAAAQRVWPTVNRSALARAFDALSSQRVSLGACRIDISGATARATCSGSATWTARVGDGSPRTEAREWTFELAGDGGAWRILSARTQNR